MRPNLISFAVVALFAATAVFADEPLSEAKEAMKHAVDAIRGENEAALEQYMVFSSREQEADWEHRVLQIFVTRQRLDRLSIQKFGRTLPAADAIQPHMYLTQENLKKLSDAVAEAKLVSKGPAPGVLRIGIMLRGTGLIGDADSKDPKQQAASEIAMQKVDGKWRIDLASILRPPRNDARDPRLSPNQRAFFDSILTQQIRSWKEAADGIESGRYKTEEMANEAAGHG